MPRFVILRHQRPNETHFDLMLEVEGVLKTWSLPQAPEIGVEMECEALPDHRLAYLDYEGPISAGRGAVTRWDRGQYVTERRTETQWIANVVGEKISGTLTIEWSKDDPRKGVAKIV
jgi:hypothetical protein